ncbi:hypothetical protein [Cytophaga aurantiaca]|uniref:hypothetical protein n=1 Tax=Cytophaga aurantiaca TaxID=29530 RepID=UPI0003688003|nr:hypothetical protein [Cytophaga aurantiaca]
MEQATSQAKVLKINHSILTNAATFNHSLFNSLVTSMQEHVKERNCDVEIYTEEFDGKHITGEETEHLFDSLEILNIWLKTTYPNNI